MSKQGSVVFDYDLLAREIVTHLRGKISQRSLSAKLGYSFNQVGKWESGVTKIKWNEFLAMSLSLDVNIENSIRLLFFGQNEKFNATTSLFTLERALGLSTNLEFSESKQVRKWLSGKVKPHFTSVLKALDTRPSMLIGWLSFFMDCHKLPTLKSSYEEFLLRLDGVLNDPNCVYVNAALQLQVYKDLKNHDDKILATHAACSVEQLKKTLALMKDQHIISVVGKKYVACPFDFSFSALPMIKLRTLTKYTTELAAKRYPLVPRGGDRNATPNVSMSSVRVVAMSSATSRKVADLIAKFHNEMANYVKEDRLTKENVQIIILHSFASNI